MDKPANSYEILLKSRQFTPSEGWEKEMGALTAEVTPRQRVHVLIQFHSKPDIASRKALSEAGIKLLDYVPNNSWFASIPVDLDPDFPALSMVRWMGEILPNDKLSKALLEVVHGDRRLVEGGKIAINVKYFTDADLIALRSRLKVLSAKVIKEEPLLKSMTISLDPENIQSIANDNAVLWMEPVGSGGQPESDRASAHTQVNLAQDMGLTGDGIRVGIFEPNHIFKDHPDFDTRAATPDWEAGIDEPFYHPTNVAGIIGGNGSQSQSEFSTETNQWRGMAPMVEIYSFDQSNSTGFGSDMAWANSVNSIHVANNSWGDSSCSTYGEYQGLCTFLDNVVHGEHTAPFGGRLPIVFSVGNDRNGRGNNNFDCDVFKEKVAPFKNYGTLNQPKAAKNIITVGAVDSKNNAMTEYSSWGPTADGRIKPDIVASGHHDGNIIAGVSTQSAKSCRLGGNDYITPTYDKISPINGTHTGNNGDVNLKDYPKLTCIVNQICNVQANTLKGFILTKNSTSESCIITLNRRDGVVYCDTQHNITWNTGDAYTIDRQYGCLGQTSSAAAVTTGAIALLLEEYYKHYTSAPLSSTIKALLIHTAQDLDDETSWYNKGPDYASGFGLLRIKNAIEHLKVDGFVEKKVYARESDSHSDSQQIHYRFNVTPGEPNVKVTLVWDDEPAAPNASLTLVSDLDLVLRDPNGNFHYPWTLDPDNEENSAVRTKADHINNVEQVLVDNPISGTWKAIVSGTNINDTDGFQEFSLVGPAFTPALNCEQATELKENVPYTGQIDSFDVSNIDYYSQYPYFPFTMKGPEVVHTITTTSSGNLYIRLTDTTGNLLALILGTCDPESARDWTNPDDAVYKYAPPGTYYIVVDSFEIQNGQYTLMASLNDSDFDGIEDSIDTDPNTFSDKFNNGTTNGEINQRGGQYLTIKNVLSSGDDGILIKADEAGKEEVAIINACYGIAEYKLSAGDEEEVTCGSVTTTVTKGSVEITFFGDNGRIITTTLSAGNTLIYDETTFTLNAPSTNTEPVTVISGGREITINPGDSIKVFEQAIVDIDPNTLNLKSKGKWITSYIKLPEGYHIGDIDIQTVMLNDTIPPEKSSIEGEVLIVKFSGKKVIDLIKGMGLTLPANVDLKITLQSYIGTIFEGKDTVNILNK